MPYFQYKRLCTLCVSSSWLSPSAGKDNALALAKSNATLRRTDLSCELVGSLAFGWLYSNVGVTAAVASATFLAVVLLPLQMYCILWVREAGGRLSSKQH